MDQVWVQQGRSPSFWVELRPLLFQASGTEYVSQVVPEGGGLQKDHPHSLPCSSLWLTETFFPDIFMCCQHAGSEGVKDQSLVSKTAGLAGFGRAAAGSQGSRGETEGR